jgi:hypothetical protein
MERGRHLITELAATTNISYKKALCIRIRPFNLRHTSPPIGATCTSFEAAVPVDGSSPTLYHVITVPDREDRQSFNEPRGRWPDYGRCDNVSYQFRYSITCNDGNWSAPSYSASCNY